MTQRFENLLFTWHKDFNLLFMTQWIEPSCEPSCEHDSMKWASFYMTQRIELFFSWIWLKELNFWTTRIEPFIEYDARNWTFSGIWLNGFFLKKLPQIIEHFSTSLIELNPFQTWLTELNPFWTWLTELNLFVQFDSQNWTLCKIWFFYWKNMTHRIERFLKQRLKEFFMTQIFELSPL